MGWHLQYQLLRDTALTAAELAASAALNREAATTAWDGSPFVSTTTATAVTMTTPPPRCW